MKAVIVLGGQQHIVQKGDELIVDRLSDDKPLIIEPLAVFDDKSINIGTPTVKGAKVSLTVEDNELKGAKVKIMKFQAKKRVKTLTGHRQPQTKLIVKNITTA